ncbi:MAG: hypothetical protein ACTSUB_05870 [Candidatus Thorarchaeota archaeon]
MRILSSLVFVYMCWLVYTLMAGQWDWDAPYIFMVTVFRLLSMLLFFVATLVLSGLVAAFIGASPGTALIGVYNTLLIRMWYMNPYGVDGPFDSIEMVYANFMSHIDTLLDIMLNSSFIFLYFLFAGLGIVLFLQSLVRMEHKFVGGAFISIQAILIVASFRVIEFGFFTEFPTDFFFFITTPLQILAFVSFVYLEVSYQMIYSYSVGKPVEERENTLKKQLLALRQATRKQDAIERGEKVSITAMSRTSGATAFSFLREAIERKVAGEKESLENMDAIADVRRLQIFVDDLLATDPAARDELTAKAAAPSSSYVISSTIIGSAFRFVGVVLISFVFMNPAVFTSLFNLPPGIENSVELLQPELVIFFLVPVLLLFPLSAMVIGWSSQREQVTKLTKAEKDEKRAKKKDLAKRKKEAKLARKERERARKKRKDADDGDDEWDKALEETYKK